MGYLFDVKTESRSLIFKRSSMRYELLQMKGYLLMQEALFDVKNNIFILDLIFFVVVFIKRYAFGTRGLVRYEIIFKYMLKRMFWI